MVWHGLEIVLNAALKTNKNITFLIIGEGARKNILMSKARKMNIKNIKFINHLDWQEIIDINQLIDVHLYT